ncbi:MAG TPA: Flp family type IVb pilin [Acidobacteriaceae bacterium]|nr:Flp family type IVb pilin [Acidobacteriaceae bacterium]
MNSQFELLRAFYADESGQDLMEYALIVALISLVAIASLGTLGKNISDYIFKNIAAPMPG